MLQRELERKEERGREEKRGRRGEERKGRKRDTEGRQSYASKVRDLIPSSKE